FVPSCWRPPSGAPLTNLEARRDPRTFNVDTTGWVKFSTGMLPNWAQITSMRLYLTLALVGGTTTPELEIWYSKNDNWTRAAIPTGLDVDRTLALTPRSAPGTIEEAQSFDLNVSLRDWLSDLQSGDDYLTLGISNPVTTYSFATYYGTDTALKAPI